MSESITATHLNDLRKRVLEHQAAVKEGTAKPSDAPYTIEELRDALAAISLNREAIAAQTPAKRKKATVKAVDLTDLL